MNITPTILHAERSKLDMSANIQLLNSSELDYYTLIELPFSCSDNYRLFGIIDLETKSDIYSCELDETYRPFVIREGNKWLKIRTSLLSSSPGGHHYKLNFFQSCNAEFTYSLYFGYIIQEDNPDKPYVYMNTTESNE